MESIDHVSILDPLDISLRLAELGQLQDGWLEGKGKAPAKEGIVWLEQAFESNYPEYLTLPYLFPTGEGGFLAEWSASPSEVSLEIDPEAKTGFYHCINLETEEELEEPIDLSISDGWTKLIQNLDKIFHNS